MSINIVFSVWIYEVDGGKHAYSIFALGIELWKRGRLVQRQVGTLVL